MPGPIEALLQALGIGGGTVAPINPNTAQGQPAALPLASASQPAQLPPSAPAPQQGGGFMQGATNFLANPLTQGALGAYLGAISSPRLSGWGGALGRGGLAGLGAFGQAQALQSEAGKADLEKQRLGLEVGGAKAKQDAIDRINAGTAKPGDYVLAGATEMYTAGQKKQDFLGSNKAIAQDFITGHPNDPVAARLGAAAMKNDQALIDPSDLETNLQAIKLAPQKEKLLAAQIAGEEAGISEKTATAKKTGEETAAFEALSPEDKKKFLLGGAGEPKPESPEAATLKTAEARAKYGAEWDAAHPFAKHFMTEAQTADRNAYIEEHMGAGGPKAVEPGLLSTPAPTGATVVGPTIKKDGKTYTGYSDGHYHEVH